MARDKTRLTAVELSTFLEHHPQWRVEGDVIRRTFEFSKFADGIRFVDRVASAADSADHHPDIDIRYTKVSLALTTHDANGLTFRDTQLAETADKLFKAS